MPAETRHRPAPTADPVAPAPVPALVPGGSGDAAPAPRQAPVARTVLREVVLPGAAWVVGLAAAGRVIVGPLRGFAAEDAVNEALVRRRTPAGDRWTWAVSTYADTPATIAAALGYGAAGWARTGRVRDAAAPLAAITLETVVFMSAAALVGRPRPDVPWLDRPAPTSSFPSGHTGATTALHGTIATQLGDHVAAPALRYAFPPLVGYSRLYRGMHHPSDVAAGIALGLWSARAVRRVLRLDDPA